MQWSAIRPGGKLPVSRPRLCTGQFRRHRDVAIQRVRNPLDATQINVGQPLAGQLARADPLRLRNHGRVCNIGVIPGHGPRIPVRKSDVVRLRRI